MEVTPGVSIATLSLADGANQTNFAALVNSATFANGKISDFLSTNRPFSKGGGSPEEVLGQLWIQTAVSGFFSIMYYNGSNFAPLSSGISLVNESGQDLQAGDGVQLSDTAGQMVIAGGDHGFGDFGDYLDAVFDFCGINI